MWWRKGKDNRRLWLGIGIAILSVWPTAASAQPVLRQMHWFADDPSEDLHIAASEGVFLDVGSACAPYASCLHFAEPGTGTYDTGERYFASMTTRPLYVFEGSQLWLETAWETESFSPYDEVKVEIQCEGDPSWTEVHRAYDSTAVELSGMSLELPEGASDRLCELRFLFDSVDGVFNDHVGWRIAAFGLRLTTTDLDGDGVGDEEDNCPSVPNPDQELAPEGRVGQACQAGLFDLMLPALANRWHVQGLTEHTTPEFYRYEVSGLPPGFDWTIEPYGNPLFPRGALKVYGSTPAPGEFTVSVLAYAGPDYWSEREYHLRTFEPLTEYQRKLLTALALQPRPKTDGTVDFLSVTRLDKNPVFYWNGLGREADGTLSAMRQVLELYYADAVDLFTAGTFSASFSDEDASTAGPDVMPITVQLGVVAPSDRTTSVEYIDELGRPSDNGTGEVVSGTLTYAPTLWSSYASEFEAPEVGAWECDIPEYPVSECHALRYLGEGVAHELGHILNGHHTWLDGPGFVQQRERVDILRSGEGFYDIGYHFDEDELLVYQLLYHMRVGAGPDALQVAGLIGGADLFPAPVVTAVTPVEWTGSYWRAAPGPIHPGDRVLVQGGLFRGFWGSQQSPFNTWGEPVIRVPGVASPVPIDVAEIGPRLQGYGTQFARVVLPLETVSGDLFVESTHPDSGEVRISDPFPIEVVP